MKRIAYFTIVCIFFCSSDRIQAQDSLVNCCKYEFKGQISLWTQYNPDNAYPFYAGGRYIPQFNLERTFSNNQLLDMEASANMASEFGLANWDSTSYTDFLSPYRLWLRYSSSQWELRAGLQKINFGSAKMLRPLMWFDEIDPRDPLKLTSGVWGLLGRYYFMNNANIWLWSLYENTESDLSNLQDINWAKPGFGGRVQIPVPLGEAAISYHHGQTPGLPTSTSVDNYVQNHLLGLDIRWDWIVGLWIEAAVSQSPDDLAIVQSSKQINIGADYTFGLGNGLLLGMEHLIIDYENLLQKTDKPFNLSAIQLNYPVGMFDNISAMFYVDWQSETVYNFINWQRTYDRIALNLMAYWNPENSVLPSGNNVGNRFAGKGIQLLFTFNH